MSGLNIGKLLADVIHSVEDESGEKVNWQIEDGIVYIKFKNGAFIDFTIPKYNRADQERYDSVTVTGSDRLVDNED